MPAGGVDTRGAGRGFSSLLVTGGAGFVGGNFIRMVLASRTTAKITALDSLSGRGVAPVLEGLESQCGGRFTLVKAALHEKETLQELFCRFGFDAVLHFAAKNPSGQGAGSGREYAEVNVLGTAMVLDIARRHWKGRGIAGRFMHLSSYEVYGSHPEGYFTEGTRLNPSTPYAASKAAADELTLSYHRTFGMDALVTRTTNIYGPYQSGDKLIPALAARAAKREPMPVYGDGSTRRDWIHVDDHNRGVLTVLERGRAGEVYHIGARCEKTNLDIAREVAADVALASGMPQESLMNLVTLVQDRRGHDPRRALGTDKIESELGFRAQVDFKDGLMETVRRLIGIVGRE